MSKPFFINIVPTNDRREIQSYTDILNEIFNTDIHEYFKYSLFTVGEKRFDPSVVLQLVLNINNKISPLIAVNPYYQHPTLTAKKIATIQNFYPSLKIGLNLVTGSFMTDQKNAGDLTTTVERNKRLIEFFKCLDELASETSKSSLNGDFYKLNDFSQYPIINKENFPVILSGNYINELRPFKNVYYLKNYRPTEILEQNKDPNCGLAIGVFTRENESEAIREFEKLYPRDRKGEMLFSFALNNSETNWNVWLKNYLSTSDANRMDYNLVPMLTLRSAAPFIVGSYENVISQIKKLNSLGYDFFTMDFEPSEYPHIKNILKAFI